ncbi:MAG: hypothetical protein ACRET2_02225, partial [Steroidobacteraceae bacterium]
LRSYYSTHRELAVTQARGQVLDQVSQHRITSEHAARDEEEDRESGDHASNQAAAQGRQFANAQSLQNSGFVNSNELQARNQDRAGRVQASRAAVLQASQARAQKAQIRDWLSKYQATVHVPGRLQGDPLTPQDFAQMARHDSVLASQLQAYKDADTREQAASRAMRFPDDPYLIPGVGSGSSGGAPTPPSVPSYLMQQPPGQGPGMADQPYPQDSGADETWMSGGGSGDSGTAGADDDGSGS